jgi:acyl phosphate:glycerol-3-phosphate acyltransferase
VNAVVACAIGWLLGSVPSAWLLVRWRTGKDLAGEGSGNVGTVNSLRVSRSRGLAAAVLLLDLAKGAGAVLLARLLVPDLGVGLAAGTLAVLGHSVNPWLTLKRRRISGGKGLAPASGVFVVMAPLLVLVWFAVFGVGHLLLRRTRGIVDEAPASLAATLAVPPAAWLLYGAAIALGALAVAAILVARMLREVRDVWREAAVSGGRACRGSAADGPPTPDANAPRE